MTDRLNHSHQRNLRYWIAGGFVAQAVIFCAIFNPLGPGIDPGEFGDRRNVVVAKVEIPLGSRIIPEQLEIKQFPANVTPEGAIGVIDDNLIGRVVVASISPREPITESRLAPVGAAGALSSMIPEGYRAVTVKVDHVVGASGLLMRGSFVDVVVILPMSQAGATKGPISKIVLQNIKVLASGAKIDSSDNQRQPSEVQAVTLQVTTKQAEKLWLAANEGKLQLVMRNYPSRFERRSTEPQRRMMLVPLLKEEIPT